MDDVDGNMVGMAGTMNNMADMVDSTVDNSVDKDKMTDLKSFPKIHLKTALPTDK